MKIRPWLLVAAVMTPLASAACSGTTSGTTGTGGSTSASTSTSTSDATSTSSGSTSSATSSGTGGAGSCVGVFPVGACATCGEASCCTQGAACDAAAGCIGCVYSSDPSCTAANKPAVDALLACMHASCEAACFPTPPPPSDVTCTAPAPSPSLGACISVCGAIECNPVTNAPCDTAGGEACDFKGDGYHCYAAPNDKNLCEACGSTAGNCKGGSTCLPGPDGNCGKFCCDDSDCGKGKCNKADMLPGNVGYCVGGNP